MRRLHRLLVLPAAALGLALSDMLYLNVVGSIGPVELVEVLLLAIPLTVILLRLMRAGLAALAARPSRPRSGARTAGSARRSS
jgi:hypothetical protein